MRVKVQKSFVAPSASDKVSIHVSHYVLLLKR
jgi:hypothetical protein